MNKLAELLEFISSQHVINDKDKLQADDVSVLPTWYVGGTIEHKNSNIAKAPITITQRMQHSRHAAIAAFFWAITKSLGGLYCS